MAQSEPSIVFGVFKGMGDLLWATPVLQAELERGVSVHLLLLPGPALRELIDLLDLSPHRNKLHLHTIPSSRGAIEWWIFLEEMKTLSPERIWLSPHAPAAAASWKAPLLLRSLQMLFWPYAKIIGADSEPLSQLLHQRLPVKRDLPLKQREWSAYRLLRGDDLPEPSPVPRFERAVLDRRLETPRYDLAIFPGAGAKNRIWPEQNYPALLSLLPPAWKIAVVGLPADVTRIQQVFPSDRAIDYGTGTLRESLLTLASARTALVMDSGPMHFADALGVPAVAIFLKDEPSTVIDLQSCILPVYEQRFPCQPCGRAVCDQPAIYCLDTVDPAAVAGRIQQAWARPDPVNPLPTVM